MRTGRTYGRIGLLPIRRFIALGEGHNLPEKAHNGTIQGLLEPEPDSWIKNPEFPYLWHYLMHDICREEETMLLSFEIRKSDKAFVVDRAHIERALYLEHNTQIKPTRKQMNEAYRKYWESRVPVYDYNGGYCCPQLTIWSPVCLGRLHIEWTKDTNTLWKNLSLS